ncbi:MAG: lipoyl(octanoyl) transferase LipB [Gammaproteobacteria bacterium]|nr:lipoyl(octanoyl) transferase LipB [Gammaproteobacteria bacterium]MBT8135116.1 lipoyl(octanoyl) transferase LipB [Gammaproteobacteria bacterium]NNJ51088.1 lipoyl(octanoyl) transferase LipB [Gammaproteobacteria bacterium]
MRAVIRHLGEVDYLKTWQAMQQFTDSRDGSTADEIWFLQHPPVYTLGKNGKPEHILNPKDIPVVNSDRGGQVTYHGPGQIIVYTLLDLNRLNIGVRELVTRLEQSVIELLADYGVDSSARRDAPGVYVNNAKIAALGLRVRKGCSFHGLALNVDMDLEPFRRINPCGYEGLEVTRLKDIIKDIEIENVVGDLQQQLLNKFAL